ncbi:acetyltransferase [Cylindrospermum stagnale PCC 7417]|uniref:Acetyltransferase n=1 Tax=Cylindrospermum stagnale PCC 7417 TaxID=56107 RepID=K9X2L0_9NOST|nr:GNAT family N-acetyltransferase [Cylindrospermum stagnale]AFZ26319.1 acetyltransferase [Cylindrospermum stagnale PCC 7417]
MIAPDNVDIFDDYLIKPLEKENRAAFCCGVDALDNYLKQRAKQDADKYVAAPFVLIEKSSGAIAGYYTLSATSILFDELPPEINKKLPKYSKVPATLLGRLAVDKKYRGKGLGERLLMDALYRSFQSEIASIAVVVDAKDDGAISFYEYYDFVQFPDSRFKLFLLMKTIGEIFK